MEEKTEATGGKRRQEGEIPRDKCLQKEEYATGGRGGNKWREISRVKRRTQHDTGGK